VNTAQDLRICRKCGVLFDIEVRKNKDCPVCHSGEHMRITKQNKVHYPSEKDLRQEF
jgi:predicted Zn-ribbon and HTH transcriptional regulator